MKRSTLAVLPLLLVACGGGEDSGAGAADDASAAPDALDSAIGSTELPPWCADAGTPPKTLECTGLYSDLVAKTVASGARPYAPAVPLWSDGAHKERWISLPPNTKIDATDPNEWVFPVGTKLWKEFSRNGKRVETRLWQKVRDRFWVSATYAWNQDETAADLSNGGDIALGDGAYHIPTGSECEKCHRGRNENILGFEQVSLGQSGATGLTLRQLVVEGLISPVPASTSLTIGDDGTGAAAPALAWLHVNCGVTCHNRNSNAIAYGAGMRLRLDPTLLDGRPVTDFDPLKTTQGVTVNAPGWNGQTRIVPGDPAHSLLYSLISHRGPNVQMPPIASNLVDVDNIALVEAWIHAMTPLAVDAGNDAADARDVGVDARVLDTGPADVSTMPDVSTDAPTAPDVVDAGLDATPVDDVSVDEGLARDAGDGGADGDTAQPSDAGALDVSTPDDAGSPGEAGVDATDGSSSSDAEADAGSDDADQDADASPDEPLSPAEPPDGGIEGGDEP